MHRSRYIKALDDTYNSVPETIYIGTEFIYARQLIIDEIRNEARKDDRLFNSELVEVLTYVPSQSDKVSQCLKS